MMKNVKEKLKEAINNYSIQSHNKKILEEHFGSENLKNLPFSYLKVLLSYNDSDGNEYLEIDFKTFKIDHYCMIADMGEPLLSESMVKAIEQELFKMLYV